MNLRKYMEATKSFFFPHIADDISIIVDEVVKRLKYSFKPSAALMAEKSAEERNVLLMLQIQYLIWTVSFETKSKPVRSEENHAAFQLLSTLSILYPKFREPCPYSVPGSIFKTLAPKQFCETANYVAVRQKLRTGLNCQIMGLNEHGNVGVYIRRLRSVVYINQHLLEMEKENHSEDSCLPFVLEPLRTAHHFQKNLARVTCALYFCQHCCSAMLYCLGKSCLWRTSEESLFVKHLAQTFQYIVKPTSSENTNESAIFCRDRFSFSPSSNEVDDLVNKLFTFQNVIDLSEYLKTPNWIIEDINNNGGINPFLVEL
ncbi:unnamed protein product [Auanema sp. JU1783]|nr:unnamed protein product [Auanema sp. JU1783]